VSSSRSNSAHQETTTTAMVKSPDHQDNRIVTKEVTMPTAETPTHVVAMSAHCAVVVATTTVVATETEKVASVAAAVAMVVSSVAIVTVVNANSNSSAVATRVAKRPPNPSTASSRTNDEVQASQLLYKGP